MNGWIWRLRVFLLKKKNDEKQTQNEKWKIIDWTDESDRIFKKFEHSEHSLTHIHTYYTFRYESLNLNFMLRFEFLGELSRVCLFVVKNENEQTHWMRDEEKVQKKKQKKKKRETEETIRFLSHAQLLFCFSCFFFL